ncbi:conserved hypothetical protein [Mucor ambiguus]|uniref:Uncharacterized protein n=1 Tax=Mucor ambiguus TaxID=91626 RepID=A0A0C9LRX8_9FUNG|nr:conserved hypothetical protein [Mucor ambiguus]
MQHQTASGSFKNELTDTGNMHHDVGYATSGTKSSTSSISADDESLIENNRQDTHNEESQKLTTSQIIRLYWTYLQPMVLMLIINVGIPLALYYTLKIWLSPLVALIISGIPPLLHVFYVFWKRRRVDVLGCIFVAGFIISGVLSAISGDARLTLLRDSTITAVVGVLFLVTLIPIRTKWFTVRPIVFLFTQQLMAEQPPVEWKDKEGNDRSMKRSEWIWHNSAFYRKFSYVICGAWGILLLAEFAAKVIMIKSTLTLDQVVLYSNIMVVVIVVSMTAATLVFSSYLGKRIMKDGEAWAKENTFEGRVPNEKRNLVILSRWQSDDYVPEYLLRAPLQRTWDHSLSEQYISEP